MCSCLLKLQNPCFHSTQMVLTHTQTLRLNHPSCSLIWTLQSTHLQRVYTSLWQRPLWNELSSTLMWMLQTEPGHITRLFRDFLCFFLNQHLILEVILESFSVAKVRTERLHLLKRNRIVDYTVFKNMDTFCRWTLLLSHHSCLLMLDCFNSFKRIMLY